MTDPIGTAQERELIELMARRNGADFDGECTLTEDEVRAITDALQSRIAEVGRLEERVRELEDSLGWIARQLDGDYKAARAREVETPAAPHEHFAEGLADGYADAFNTVAQAMQRRGMSALSLHRRPT